MTIDRFLPLRPPRSGLWLPTLGLLGCLLALAPNPAWSQGENILDRITNERMQAFEQKLTGMLSQGLSRYISLSQYVLTVKVHWSPDVIAAVSNPELKPEQQKLPGFPIFVKPPNGQDVDNGAPSFNRLVVRVLLDETLPEYYERFVRKIVPIVARFDTVRGDQVIVIKETFPFLSKEDAPPTLPEKELLQQLGGKIQALEPEQKPAAKVEDDVEPTSAAQLAFDEGRYSDALRIVQRAFQRATTNKQRAVFLAMEGSTFYSMNNEQAARASWERALVFDPTNDEIHQVLNFLDVKK